MTDTERTIADPAIGAVALRVADLARSLAFYTQRLGLALIERSGEGAWGHARLGTAERVLLELQGAPGAPAAAPGTTGLYHFAILLPERSDLARFLAGALRERLDFVGFADHYVSEAAYLTDPDGNGIEIYADRPRALWEGQVAQRMTTLPLDLESLLGELGDQRAARYDALPAGSVIGHVHLKVADIPSTIAFYRDALGMECTARLGSRAAFFSWGGYHHHIGANTWESAGGRAPDPAATGLLATTLVVAEEARRTDMIAAVAGAGYAVAEGAGSVSLTDPAGNVLRIEQGARD